MSPEATIATAKALMRVGRWLILGSMVGLGVLQIVLIAVDLKPKIEAMRDDQLRQLQQMPVIVKENE